MGNSKISTPSKANCSTELPQLKNQLKPVNLKSRPVHHRKPPSQINFKDRLIKHNSIANILQQARIIEQRARVKNMGFKKRPDFSEKSLKLEECHRKIK